MLLIFPWISYACYKYLSFLSQFSRPLSRIIVVIYCLYSNLQLILTHSPTRYACMSYYDCFSFCFATKMIKIPLCIGGGWNLMRKNLAKILFGFPLQSVKISSWFNFLLSIDIWRFLCLISILAKCQTACLAKLFWEVFCFSLLINRLDPFFLHERPIFSINWVFVTQKLLEVNSNWLVLIINWFFKMKSLVQSLSLSKIASNFRSEHY